MSKKYNLDLEQLAYLVGSVSVPFMRDNPTYVMPATELKAILDKFLNTEAKAKDPDPNDREARQVAAVAKTLDDLVQEYGVTMLLEQLGILLEDECTESAFGLNAVGRIIKELAKWES